MRGWDDARSLAFEQGGAMRNSRRGGWKRFIGAVLCVLTIIAGIGNGLFVAKAAENEPASVKVADIDTSDGYIDLMTNEAYPGATTSRYAGRIWADKSVFTDDTISMDGKDFINDSDFLISASFLGSTRSITGSEPLPIDLMVILDCSSSMANNYIPNGSGGEYTTPNDRMGNAVDALNVLFDGVKKHNADSRIGLVAYSSDTVTALPLGTYVWNDKLLSATRSTTDGFSKWDVKISCTD